MPKSDAQLLRDYAEQANEAAFREIVIRHTDLVYSAALRQVNSPDLASDVAQNVFTDLAGKAGSVAKNLTENSSLVGWLYRGTRFEALNLLREERRRQTRERQAMEESTPTPETAPEWDRLRPVLDEAMADLNDADRDALLLRYFRNQDLREVGIALGVGDDAAQKRVSRALEKLREKLSRRGIATAAGTLTIVISANAVQTAPAGLALTVATAAALTGTTVAATVTATKVIAMTTLQKTLIGATLAAAIGVAIYEARQASQLRAQIQRRQAAPLPASSNDALLSATEDRMRLLTTQNSELAAALARANTDKSQLEAEREQARHAASLYKELVEQAGSKDMNPTNEYPTARHVWAAFGRLGRVSALSKEDDGRLSAEEKSALEAARTKALEGLPNLVKAAKYFDAAEPTDDSSQAEDRLDLMACLFYGALNLDEQQFAQVYGVMQKYQQDAMQKGLSGTNSTPETTTALNQMIEQFKGEAQSLLTPEQARIFAEVLTHIHIEPGKSAFNFRF